MNGPMTGHHDSYAAKLTGFERRLLDGLERASATDRTPTRRRRRQGKSLVAAGSVAVALLGVAAGTSMLRTTPAEPANAPSAATAVAIPTAPYRYAKVTTGLEYLSMDDGHEVAIELRNDQELWLSTAPGAKRTLRVKASGYRTHDCWTRYRPELCVDWIGRHPSIELATEPVDWTLRDTPLAEALEDEPPIDLAQLLPPSSFGRYELPASLPTRLEALDRVVTELAQTAGKPFGDRVISTTRLTGQALELSRSTVLIELVGDQTLPAGVRTSAFELVRALSVVVSTDQGATDRLDRPGVRLTLANSMDSAEDAGHTELVFDPATATLLSKELYYPPPPDTRRPPYPVLVREFVLYRTGAGVPSLTSTR